MKTDMEKNTTSGGSKQRNIFIATIIAGLLFGFVSGRVWSERKAVKSIIAETKTATTTLLTKALTASTGAITIKKETPVAVKKVEVKPIIVKDEKPAVVSKIVGANTLVLPEIVAGSTVLLSKASLEKDGWVAIREDANGEFGKVLGAGWFPKGVNEKVIVELLRNTEAGKKYYAVLYTDAGDHKFSSGINKVVTENDEPVAQVFIAK